MADIVEIKQKQKEILKRIEKRSAHVRYSEYAIVLLLDTSGSMSGKKIEDAKEAIIDFLRSIDLVESEVGLVAFGGGILTCGLSQNRIPLETKIKNLVVGSETPMMTAVKTAHNLLKEKVNRVMAIATDGQPTDASEGEILDYAASIKKIGTRIITIGIGEDVNQQFLRLLASSPADYHFAKASFELKNIYKEVADMLALPEKRANYLRDSKLG